MNYDEPDPDLVAGMNELAKVNKSLRRARSPAPPRTASALSKFYKISQVLERVPISRNSLYDMAKKGEFPKPIKLGARASAWSRAEVDAWIEEKLHGGGV